MNVYEFEKYILKKGYKKYVAKFVGSKLTYEPTDIDISELSTISNIDIRYIMDNRQIIIGLGLMNTPPIVITLFNSCNIINREAYLRYEGSITCDEAYNKILRYLECF